MLRFKEFKTNLFEENCYLLYNEDFKDKCENCVIIDPGFTKDSDLEKLETFMAERSLSPAAILLTHFHFDHIAGVSPLLSRHNGLKVYMSPLNWDLKDFNNKCFEGFGFTPVDMNFSTIDIADGQILSIAGLEIKCIATPGHTSGGFCFLVGDKLFSGDTLFAGTIGRSDLATGEYDDLIRSIMEKLIWLDSDIEVFPGHGHSTTIGYERTNNPMLEPFNEPEESE